MTDLTLQDLAQEASQGPVDGSQAAQVVESEGPSWVSDLFDRLEETGKLDQLIDAVLFGQESPNNQPIEATQAPIEQPDMTQPQKPDLDAEKLHSMLLQLYDIKGDISLREMIVMVEQNPSMVNKLLEQHL